MSGTTAEKIAALTANVNNLSKNFDNLTDKVEKLVEISQQMCEFLVITKNNHESLVELNKRVEAIRSDVKKNVLEISEQFGLEYEDRSELHKDLIFLRVLRHNAEEAKQQFFKKIIEKIIEWGLIALIAGFTIPNVIGG